MTTKWDEIRHRAIRQRVHHRVDYLERLLVAIYCSTTDPLTKELVRTDFAESAAYKRLMTRRANNPLEASNAMG